MGRHASSWHSRPDGHPPPRGFLRAWIDGIELVPAVDVDRVEVAGYNARKRGVRFELIVTVRPDEWAVPGGGRMTTDQLSARARATATSFWLKDPAGFWFQSVRGRIR